MNQLQKQQNVEQMIEECCMGFKDISFSFIMKGKEYKLCPLQIKICDYQSDEEINFKKNTYNLCIKNDN